MKRVLIIGAGKRVLGGILPAFACLRDRFEVAGIVATERRELTAFDGTAFSTLDQIPRLADIDLITVAVPPRHVARVIDKLVAQDVSRCTLMLDTPVLPLRGLAAVPKLRAFRRALVAEDTIALPPFVLARQLIDAGEIGELRRIWFFHCGYRYHALASFKMLARSRTIRHLSGKKYAGKVRIKDLELEHGVTATMFEPRDYAIGRFLIEGTRGAIADYDLARDHVRRISYRLDGPVVQGLELDGTPVPETVLDHTYRATITPAVPEVTPMNSMKIRGLLDLLVAVDDDDPALHYSVAEGLADSLMIDAVDRLGRVPTPHWLSKLLSIAS